jgi:hypothetical protein
MIAGKGVKLQRIIDSRPGDPPILLMARAGTGQISLARNGFENHRTERDMLIRSWPLTLPKPPRSGSLLDQFRRSTRFGGPRIPVLARVMITYGWSLDHNVRRKVPPLGELGMRRVNTSRRPKRRKLAHLTI